MKTRSANSFGASARRQAGVYAIEYALTFLIFFSLVYMLISYGIFFGFRFGMQSAAEDGARAALRFQPVTSGSSWPARKAKAEEVAGLGVSAWLPGTPVIVASLCPVTSPDCPSTPAPPSPLCSAVWAERCRVVVTVTATGMTQLLPPIINLTLPDIVTGRASVLLDGRPI